MDILSKEARSQNMAAIKSRNTKPEIYFRKWLFSQGYRYRINVKNIYGHPDIYLAKYKTAIFVNGCFWHRHKECKFAYSPKSRVEFWEKKFQQNINRDLTVHEELRKEKIKCLVIWECTIRNMKRGYIDETELMNKVKEFFQSETALYMEL